MEDVPALQPLQPRDPRWVGDYRLLARIGSGGTATVYLGQSPGGRAVAVKVMHTDLPEDQKGECRDRFWREAAMARVAGGRYSPPVVAADPEAHLPWVATEFRPALSLRDAVRAHGALPAGAVWALAAGLVDALTDVHRAGIVHLDVKPGNVLLTADGLRLIDFGIARPLGADGFAPVTAPAGTAGFMAPEQVTGPRVSPASDVYALGATLAYAAVGDSGTAPTRLDAISDDWLRDLVARCLQPDPTARPTVDALREELEAAARAGRMSAWSPALSAAIERRAREAENPPAPLPGPAPVIVAPDRRRRALLVGGVALLAAGAMGAAAVAIARGGVGARPRPADATTTRSRSAAPPTPSPRGRALEFSITGDVTLISLTYTVNGQSTTLTNVKLPWRTQVTIPPPPQRTTWRLTYQFPPGEVRYRVLVDGFVVGSGTSGSFGHPDVGGSDGTI